MIILSVGEKSRLNSLTLTIILVMILSSCDHKREPEQNSDVLIYAHNMDSNKIELLIEDTSKHYEDILNDSVTKTQIKYDYKDPYDKLTYSWTSFYPSGKIKEKGEQRGINGCGIAIGDHLFFNRKGGLTKKVKYENWLIDESGSCHESIIQDITMIRYFSNGKVKSIEYYQSKYEGEAHKVGDWQYFDSEGSLIKSENFGYKWKQ